MADRHAGPGMVVDRTNTANALSKTRKIEGVSSVYYNSRLTGFWVIVG